MKKPHSVKTSLLALLTLACVAVAGDECGPNWQWVRLADGRCSWPYCVRSDEPMTCYTVLSIPACLGGPAASPSDACVPYDYDMDGDVDLKDWAYAEDQMSNWVEAG